MKTKNTTSQTVYPTMAAAAGALGVPPAVLRQAKNAGCPGFTTGGRVDLHKLAAWLLTKGRDLKPALTLEQAKAKLAEVRAKQIERKAELAEGRHVPLVWVLDVVEDAFGQAAGWTNAEDRIGWLTNLVASGVGSLPVELVRSRLAEALAEDRRYVRIETRHIRTAIRSDLMRGPGKDFDDRNILAQVRDLWKSIAEQLSPGAKEEVRRAVALSYNDPLDPKAAAAHQPELPPGQ